MIRAARESAPRPARRGSLLAVLGVAALIVIGSLVMERSVARSLASTDGEWRFVRLALPDWFPAEFTGSLAEFGRLPEVPLRSATWRRRLTAALERNRWIARVEAIERSEEGIVFSARFRRPLAALRCESGFLLIDSRGEVIDLQAGDTLFDGWRIPEVRPRQPFPDLAPGTALTDPELAEALALLRALWGSGILDRFPGEIHALDAYSEEQTPGLLWRLHTRAGVALYWGRSPASNQVALLPTEERLRRLEQILALGDRIRGAGGITLEGPEPMVVGRL